MSLYTTELRYICESLAGLSGSTGADSIDAVVAAAAPSIFDFDYPIFDTAYKTTLERKILRHYYLREIGAETYGLWKHYLTNTMREIMPYFNQLYASQLLEFNPLADVDLTREHTITGKSDKASSSTGNNSGKSTNKYSETPQGGLNGLEEDRYLTSASIDSSSSEAVVSADEAIDTTEHYLETVLGRNGGESVSKRLMEYRKTFLNIDMQVIEKLEPLFFGLWR